MAAGAFGLLTIRLDIERRGLVDWWIGKLPMEEALRVRRRDLANVIWRLTACGRESSDRERNPCRLVSLSTVRHRRQIGRIRFYEKPLIGHEAQQCVVRPLPERDDTAERDVPAYGECLLGQ